MRITTIARKLILSAGIALGAFSALAVPPIPGFVNIPQPDGSTVEARIIGDRNFHYYQLRDGSYMMADVESGFLRPATMEKIEQLRIAHLQLREAEALKMETRAAVQPNEIKKKFPTTGTVKGLIVLAEFQDVKFQPETTVDYVSTKLNQIGFKAPEANGSAVDYFIEQSQGQFTPHFDVVGPITLPKKREDYGKNEDLDGLFRDAAIKADEAGVDYTQYDVNDDGFVDFFFVIFAGHGEAQGGPTESVWPAMKDISNYVYDMFDGMYLSVAACSCELKGGTGTNQDGVGTVCHEFSHILGLPDIYDAQNTGSLGMLHYDMMCYGSYNDDQRTPSGYTAMDKYTLGWIEPRLLDGPQKDVELKPLSTDNDCIFLVNPNNKDEYYTLENRQPIGFDAGLPGHGLVISYVHYDRNHWAKNTVNTLMAGYDHVGMVCADNSPILNTTASATNHEAGDTFPGAKGVTEFTDNTKPAAVWKASGKQIPVGMPITNIRELEDGTILFDFMQGSGIAEIEDGSFGEAVEYFTLQGMRVSADNLTPGIYIVRDSEGRTRKVTL